MDSLAVPELLTVTEVAQLLRVSRATIDRWTRQERFVRPYKFGGAIQRFSRAEVLNFLANQQTTAPLAARTRKATRKTRKSTR